MRKRLALLVGFALVLTAAIPAQAQDAGVLAGSARVGKAGGCLSPSAGGLGLPWFNGTKNAYWKFDTTLQALSHGAGILRACGRMTKVPILPGSSNSDEPLFGVIPTNQTLGASCAMSKGFDGTGEITFAAGTVNLRNIGWKATVGSVIPLSAAVSGLWVGTFLALMAAEGGAACLTKTPAAGPHKKQTKAGGATQLMLVGAFLNFPGYIDPNILPVFCKNGFRPAQFDFCHYPPKKRAV